MNQNQTESKPQDVEEPRDEGLDETACSTSSARADHLAWCKKRALEYCDMGDVSQAFASMASDLNKDESTAGHIGIQLGMMQLMGGGMLSTPDQMRHFIEGFN